MPRVAGEQQGCARGWQKIKYVPGVVVGRGGGPKGWQEE